MSINEDFVALFNDNLFLKNHAKHLFDYSVDASNVIRDYFHSFDQNIVGIRVVLNTFCRIKQRGASAVVRTFYNKRKRAQKCSTSPYTGRGIT